MWNSPFKHAARNRVKSPRLHSWPSATKAASAAQPHPPTEIHTIRKSYLYGMPECCGGYGAAGKSGGRCVRGGDTYTKSGAVPCGYPGRTCAVRTIPGQSGSSVFHFLKKHTIYAGQRSLCNIGSRGKFRAF